MSVADLFFMTRHVRAAPRGSGRRVRLDRDTELVSGKDAARLWRQVGRLGKKPPGWFVGKFCKLPLHAPDGSGEFIWTEALEARAGQVCGVLNNEPIKLPGLHRGDPVCFAPAEVMQVMTPAQAEAAVKRAGGRARPGYLPGRAGARFQALVAKLKRRGDVRDPEALAAEIGRRKYGKQRFQQMAAAGQRRARR